MSEDPSKEFCDFKTLHDQFVATTPTWKFWFRTQVAILAMQLSATAYDFTLPAFLGLWLPFFCCFVLATIPLHIISRKRDILCHKMTAATFQLRLAAIAEEEENYRLITGEERR